MKFLKPTWAEIDTMCEELALTIEKSGFKPDVIVGIARGGWVPARLLSDKMNNEHVASMRVEFYTAPGVTNRVPKITQPVSTDVKGKRVLLVDDVSDTGHSLEVAFKSFADAKEVRTATLHYKPHSVFKPDYFIGTTSDWIVYPWEVNETERKLKGKKA
ncbi:MAG: phosphoribosyltransferase [Candidatus Burarchaeum sp.]|nr:phosphoribosyltransferase [Candidatus Burarchaeum sp.]MDO8339786.1 phosphoribosyltransferase [Candidatus Burarchaeum sp.]